MVQTMFNLFNYLKVAQMVILFCFRPLSIAILVNKSNRVWTIDAFSSVFVPLYDTFTCSFVLLLLAQIVILSCFRPLSTAILVINGDFTRFQLVSDGRTDGRTHHLIEMRGHIYSVFHAKPAFSNRFISKNIFNRVIMKISS